LRLGLSTCPFECSAPSRLQGQRSPCSRLCCSPARCLFGRDEARSCRRRFFATPRIGCASRGSRHSALSVAAAAAVGKLFGTTIS
jgi:hypothetical protein